MFLKTKKENREELKALIKNSRDVFDYLAHLSQQLSDPKKNKLSEREVAGMKREIINALKKIDENSNRIIGFIAYEDVRHEAFTKTFKLDQYYDYNVHIKDNNK